MHKVIFSILAALVAFNVYGIGATQEWVKRQLAAYMRTPGSTNSTITGTIAGSAFSGGDCVGDATCEIKTEIGSHVALKVVASGVSEIPAGTFYARDEQGHFQNAKTDFLTTIYASSYVVNRTVTNALGVASVKSVRMGNFWAVDSTGKAWRMGIRGGDTILYQTDAPSRFLAIRSTTIPARAANEILPRPVSLFGAPSVFLAVFPLHAATDSEIQYTVNSEKTYTIGQITITRTDKRGNKREIKFTPDGLECVYKGPNGPFKTKEEARAAVMDLNNWGFPTDWDKIWNVENTGNMSLEDFLNSDAWKYLLDSIEAERVEVEIENPQPYEHPCPAPSDYWDWSATAKDWVVKPAYDTAEELDEWRGKNGCVCGFEGCENAGTPKHSVGRVRRKDGEFIVTDEDGDGCKCCIRCITYGSDMWATVNEYNDHRANGADSGFCGCACGWYNDENEGEWPRDFHNRPSRVGGKDFACLCYCGKAKAANGEYVQHIKYRGDSPWCDKICSACEMVEDEEKYIPHNYPAFDTRHVTLRAPEWNDHTARKETTDPVGMPNDPTYYDRCGCACGAYDESKSSGLPAEFAAFHQQKMGSCRCHCGQTHTKNMRGDETVEPFPCPEICAVCFKVEDKESDAVFTFNGEQYKKLVLIDPTEEKHHAAHEVLCGCKCYNEVTTRHEWSIGGVAAQSVSSDGGKLPVFHVVNADGCGCECDGVIRKELVAAFHPGPNDTLGGCWCKCGERHIGYHQPTKCRVCANCGKTEGGDLPDDESLHTLKSGAVNDQGLNICRCDCGYFSSDGVFTSPDGGSNTVWEAIGRAPSASGKLHDFDRSNASKNEIGSMPCLCWCGGKHEARMATTYQKNAYGDKICESICTYCKERTKDGKAATELDHDPIPASKKHCGCKCGYYGISDDHEAVGRAAQSAHLHIQSKGNAEGVAYCQCFGEGTGGKHHWHYPNAADTCPKICKYRRSGKDPLGHLATVSGHESGITDATPTDHEPKEYGCGCKCGLCGKGSAPLWKDDKTLHNHAQNATDQCHCDCEAKHLIGSGEGGHEWPPLAAVNACTCTCGEKHRDDWVNACGFCSVCGNIWRDGRRLDASVKQNHLWTYGGCYCDGGCVVGGAKILHPDGHRYMKNKCVCLCGETTREHILVEQKERVGQWTCWKCNAVFLNFRVTTVCSRCGTTVSTEHIGSVGEHNPGCGEPKPSCWKCGCHCTTWGTHTTCNAHYCNACCTKKPPKPPRPPKPNPDDPNPDEPEPEPPEPYITCKHPRTETHDWDYHWTCEECSSDFHNWGWRKYCADCGAYIDSENHNEGAHGPPCNGEESDDPGHVCEPSLCGEALNDGGTCSESFCHSCESCPNASQHKNHHGGNGGSGGGGLDDI